MARLLRRLQRCFHRKPVRFFTFFLLYLMAGSLVFLHAVFTSDNSTQPNIAWNVARGSAGGVGKGTHGTTGQTGISWTKDNTVHERGSDHTKSWNPDLKARTIKESDDSRAKYIGCYADDIQKRTLKGASFFDYRKMTVFRCQDNCAERGYLYAGLEFGAECYCGHKIQASNASKSDCNMECSGERGTICGGTNRLSIYRLELAQESVRRYGSATFKGCFRRPKDVALALPVSAVIMNMSVDKCVDLCTEKELSLAVLGGQRCFCGYPTSHFTLHELEEEELCKHHCEGDDFESCGTEEYFMVYQTQVQDKRCMDRRFLPERSKQLVALASFPGAGNTWARHLIELASGYYTGSYYFDGSLYNKGFRGEKDHWRSGRTICSKTHESGRREIEAFDAAILVIRNPYKALMAEFNRKYGGHIGFASRAHWKGRACREKTIKDQALIPVVLHI